MGLDSIIRNAITTAGSVMASLMVTVTHEAWIGIGTYGEPLYSAPISRQAVVEFKQRVRTNAEGQEIEQQASVIFVDPITANGAAGRKEPIDLRDRITLPNGYTGPVLIVEGVVDPLTNLPYSLEVVLG